MSEINPFVAKYMFERTLNGIIKNSNLPLYVLEPLLRDVYKDVKSALDKETQDRINAYNSTIDKGGADEVSK